MPDKYIIQRRTASGLETVAELPALENGKIDMSWLPFVGESGAAIIARGSNANGEWVRWADGTQVCWAMLTAVSSSGNRARIIWNYPASFGSASYPAIVGIADMMSAYVAAGSVIAHVVMAESVARTAASMQVLRGDSANINQTANYNFWVLAIGRWK